MSAKTMGTKTKYLFISIAIVLLIGMMCAGIVLTTKSIASEVVSADADYVTEEAQGTFYTK